MRPPIENPIKAAAISPADFTGYAPQLAPSQRGVKRIDP
jgi:hypothetical protein